MNRQWPVQAREAHLEAERLNQEARVARSRRDSLIRRMREDDPQRWSWNAISKAVGLSREMVRKILQP